MGHAGEKRWAGCLEGGLQIKARVHTSQRQTERDKVEDKIGHLKLKIEA